MSDSFLQGVISGSNRSFVAHLIRFCLWCGIPIYAGITLLRNGLFNCGLKKREGVDIPVISIGNITTGGTGKTPTVAWVVNYLNEHGHSPGIISRGYRSLDGHENDEKRLLDQMFPNVPHFQNKQRIVAARWVEQANCDVIVVDDGFQHRQLNRDLDIVLIDVLNPFGFGYLLPRGLLREQLSGLRRAGIVLMTRCDMMGKEGVQTLTNTIRKYTSAPILRTEFRPTRLVNSAGEFRPLSDVIKYRASAFCGIGNPNGFRRTLAAIGAPVSEERFQAFPDHYHYTEKDYQHLQAWAAAQHAEILLVTRKDLVKINRVKLKQIPVWAIDIELGILESQEVLEEQILAVSR